MLYLYLDGVTASRLGVWRYITQQVIFRLFLANLQQAHRQVIAVADHKSAGAHGHRIQHLLIRDGWRWKLRNNYARLRHWIRRPRRRWRGNANSGSCAGGSAAGAVTGISSSSS